MPKISRGYQAPPSLPLRTFKVKYGLPSPDEISAEITEMLGVLEGNVAAPIADNKVNTLLELAENYHLRAQELTIRILEGERTGDIPHGHDYVKIRTGALRSFIDAAKKSFELGSRRVTLAQFEFDKTRYRLDDDDED